LGNGVVVAPPSRGLKANYEFIQGGLDDIANLPPLQNLPEHIYGKIDAPAPSPGITTGQRNNQLWRHCMKIASQCAEFHTLLEHARESNAQCLPPLEEEEVLRTAESAWGYTERGQNRFGQHGAWFPVEEVATMIEADQDAFLLLAFLRAYNGPWAHFMCANG